MDDPDRIPLSQALRYLPGPVGRVVVYDEELEVEALLLRYLEDLFCEMGYVVLLVVCGYDRCNPRRTLAAQPCLRTTESKAR